jgi:catechol 2,3-dioxygenase-like lactoylglutathione lyase family enzyme
MPASPELRRAIPLLPAPNVRDSVDFYGESLGFEEVFVDDDYASVRRGGVEIHLWQCDDRYIAENTSCRIEVDGIETLYAEYQTAGVIHPTGALEMKSTGCREFSAVDDSGNLLVFAERPL